MYYNAFKELEAEISMEVISIEPASRTKLMFALLYPLLS